MRPARLAGLLLAWVLASPAAIAHDFWIEPSTFRPEPGAETTLSLRVGERFQGETVSRDDRKIERFVVVGPQGEEPVPGDDGSDPAGVLRLTTPGLHVVGYRSRRKAITLEAAKFEAYLREEGLESVIEQRKERGESESPGREAYSRCAKTLLLLGQEASSPREGYDRTLGLRLEIVPEVDPFSGGPGSSLPCRLLFDGAPLRGALVTAMRQGAADAKESHRTDDDGRVAFTLDAAGTWMVKAVHMVQAPERLGVDWESLWASLTFEVRGAGS